MHILSFIKVKVILRYTTKHAYFWLGNAVPPWIFCGFFRTVTTQIWGTGAQTIWNRVAIVQGYSNSRCCQFKMPPTTGRNCDYFYPHYTGNQQSCLWEKYVRNVCIYRQAYAVWHARITASLCCANRIALSFAGVLHDRVFWKQLCWFLRCSVGKKKIKISSSRWWRFQLATSLLVSTIPRATWHDKSSGSHLLACFAGSFALCIQ